MRDIDSITTATTIAASSVRAGMPAPARKFSTSSLGSIAADATRPANKVATPTPHARPEIDAGPIVRRHSFGGMPCKLWSQLFVRAPTAAPVLASIVLGHPPQIPAFERAQLSLRSGLQTRRPA